MKIKTERIPIPYIDGEYINIYEPKGDVFSADVSDSKFEPGKFYKDWMSNDFTIIKADGEWHMFGITQPQPGIDKFKSGYEYDDEYMHCSEWQLFHCVAEGDSFSEVMKKGAFEDKPKILSSTERKGERLDIWAPYIIKVKDMYHLIYSPKEIRHAISEDLYNWKVTSPVFGVEEGYARDICILYDDGVYYLVYMNENRVLYRKSTDFENWSDDVLLYEDMYKAAAPESPVLIKRNGYYYLFYCVCDGRLGAYDNRTFVYAAKNIDELNGTVPITVLDAHAAEIVCENDDIYMLSAFYPENGVNAVKLSWK